MFALLALAPEHSSEINAMTASFKTAPQSVRWGALVEAAKRGVQQQGYTMTREPGRGLSNVWKLEKGGRTQLAAIRTSQDRWFAFPPLEGGTKWKTLDDVELVILAAVDSPENPRVAEVYIFPKEEVRRRFDAAYKARNKAGHVQRDDFGMWVGLDTDKRDTASSVGSGILEKYKPVAIYPLDLPTESADKVKPDAQQSDDDVDYSPPSPSTIADVMTWARERIAKLAGVGVDAVRLELKLES